jgi:hypothetical protein
LKTVDATYSVGGNSAPQSQTGYTCDDSGGASGSPVVDANTGHAIGLGHWGNVFDPNFTCLNAGTEMSKICADAGALLTCVSN